LKQNTFRTYLATQQTSLSAKNTSGDMYHVMNKPSLLCKCHTASNEHARPGNKGYCNRGG